MTVSTQLGGSPKAGVNVAAVYTAAEYAAGAGGFTAQQKYWSGEGLFEFLSSTAGATAGDLVKISSTGLAAQGTNTLLPTTEPAAVGVAVGTIAALGWGWVWRGCGKLVSGAAGCNAAASTTQAVVLYPTATAGRISSTSLGGPIQGLTVLTTTVGAGVTPVFAAGILSTVS